MESRLKRRSHQKGLLERMLAPYGLNPTKEESSRWKKIGAIGELDAVVDLGLYLAEVAAAAYLTGRCEFAEAEVKLGRYYMRECLEGIANPVEKLDSFFEGCSIGVNAANYECAVEWFFCTVKFWLGWPPNSLLKITLRRKDCGGFDYITTPAAHDLLHIEGESSFHPREVEPTVGGLVGEEE